MRERFVEKPNLPAGKVTLAAVSGKYPEITEALKRLGIRCVETPEDPRLPWPIASHADMQMFYLGNGRTFVANSSKKLTGVLQGEGLFVAETAAAPEAKYPKDVLCNALYLDGTVFANLGAIDAAIYGCLMEEQVKTIHVNQGYARCSTAVVSDRAILTMDRGIAAAAQFCGIEAMVLPERSILLDGYDYGLIGGCCGLIDKDILAFTGSLDSLDYADEVRDFLHKHHVAPLELTKNRMIDIGGILPLKEIPADGNRVF